MPRPIVASEEAERRDRAGLGVMLERVRASTWRPRAVNMQLIFHLKEALKIMTDHDRRDRPDVVARDAKKKTRSVELEAAADEAVKKASGNGSGTPKRKRRAA